jgi:sec-independent protein translocase protein TatB
MFDFAWSEIAVIAGVALVLIGPKDMPVAIRSVTGMIKKARRMAGEFQTHVDEMLREANLDEVKSTINEIRNFDLNSTVERHLDPDGSLRTTFTDNPFEPTPAVASEDLAPSAGTAALEAQSAGPVTDTLVAAAPAVAQPPDFMPPGAVPPALPMPTPDDEPEPPAFVPPEVARAVRAQHPRIGHG